jgi:RNA polymerase sigma-70 factor (ECF subfamily)
VTKDFSKAIDAGVTAMPGNSGDEVGALYRQNREGIRRYVVRTFGAGPPDPEDVVQAVFERYAAIAGAERVLNPRAFLYRSAHNYVIDERRRHPVRAEFAREIQEIADRSDDLDAERVLDSKQRWAAIEEAIARLDERSREMLLMNRLHGLSSAEIARRKGCSPTLVKSIIARALVQCHRALADDE